MNNFLWVNKPNYFRTAQSKNIVNIFPKILGDFDTIIEIGTFTGAFTYWMSQNKKESTTIFTWDNNESYREIHDSHNTEYIIDDCFSIDSIIKIKNIIDSHGRVLFLCDGGNKEMEFNLFSKYLKKNDVIMLHDYAESEEEYLRIKNEIDWPTNYESSYENIKQSLIDNNLEPYHYDEFKQVVWGSFIKK